MGSHQGQPAQGVWLWRQNLQSGLRDELPSHPEWHFREAIGPHNLTMRMWFAGGLFGLIAILALYFSITLTPWRIAASSLSPLVRDVALAAFLAFLGGIFIRGLFEAAYANPFGWIVGLLVFFGAVASLSGDAHQAQSKPRPFALPQER